MECVTRSTLSKRVGEVRKLVKWWSLQSKVRYSRIKAHGEFDDFLNDVWIRLLASIPEGKVLNHKLSVVVVHACKWELYSHAKEKSQASKAIRQIREHSEEVKSWHIMTNGDYETLELIERRDAIENAVRHLNARYRHVLTHVFGLNWSDEKTYREIGTDLRVTPERVRQILQAALYQLRVSDLAATLIESDDDLMSNPEVVVNYEKQLRKTEYGRLLLEELTKGEQ